MQNAMFNPIVLKYMTFSILAQAIYAIADIFFNYQLIMLMISSILIVLHLVTIEKWRHASNKSELYIKGKNYIQQNTTLGSLSDVKSSQAPNKLFFS